MTHKKSLNRFYPIPGYPGYFINKTTSDVLCTNEPLPVILGQAPNSKEDPYFVVQLSDGKNHFVHRLMALTFLAEEKAHVNHKDGNKQNNCLSNLEWATPSENAQHAVDTGLTTFTSSEKEVHQYTLSGSYLATFKSDAEAEKATNVAKQNISKCTLGKRPNAGGYQWRRLLLPNIAPVSCKVVKGAKVFNHTTQTEVFLPIKGQNFYGPIQEHTGFPKHKVERALQNNVANIDNYRIERVYFT